MVGDAGDLSGLEGGVCVLYCRDDFFTLDDGYGVSSQSGQFRMSRERIGEMAI